MESTDTKPTLVLGATGKTGRRVVQRLRAEGRPVRIGSRSATPEFDWEDRATWGPVLEGAGAAYIVYVPDLSVPGADETVAAFAGQARSQGVERLVLLSGRGEPVAQAAEEAVRAVDPGLTVVRASWFSQNFSEALLLDSVMAGTIALPAGDVAEPFVDADDIAEIVTDALVIERHAGRLYEVTGPRLLTFHDVAADLAKATGRTIGYVPVEADAWAAMMAGYGMPAEEIEMLNALFAEVFDGRNATLTYGVQEALGRAPRDFTDYARDAAAAGAWAAVAAGETV